MFLNNGVHVFFFTRLPLSRFIFDVLMSYFDLLISCDSLVFLLLYLTLFISYIYPKVIANTLPLWLLILQKSKYWFWASLDICYCYLFQLIFVLNTDFICCNNFALSWVERVTTGRLRFVLVIANVGALFASQMTQFFDQFKSRVTSQFIDGI